MGRHDSYVRDKWTGLRGLSPLSVEERDYSLARPWINLHIKKEW
jgi:hypothetical protein